MWTVFDVIIPKGIATVCPYHRLHYNSTMQCMHARSARNIRVPWLCRVIECHTHKHRRHHFTQRPCYNFMATDVVTPIDLTTKLTYFKMFQVTFENHGSSSSSRGSNVIKSYEFDNVKRYTYTVALGPSRSPSLCTAVACGMWDETWYGDKRIQSNDRGKYRPPWNVNRCIGYWIQTPKWVCKCFWSRCYCWELPKYTESGEEFCVI